MARLHGEGRAEDYVGADAEPQAPSASPELFKECEQMVLDLEEYLPAGIEVNTCWPMGSVGYRVQLDRVVDASMSSVLNFTFKHSRQEVLDSMLKSANSLLDDALIEATDSALGTVAVKGSRTYTVGRAAAVMLQGTRLVSQKKLLEAEAAHKRDIGAGNCDLFGPDRSPPSQRLAGGPFGSKSASAVLCDYTDRETSKMREQADRQTAEYERSTRDAMSVGRQLAKAALEAAASVGPNDYLFRAGGYSCDADVRAIDGIVVGANDKPECTVLPFDSDAAEAVEVGMRAIDSWPMPELPPKPCADCRTPIPRAKLKRHEGREYCGYCHLRASQNRPL